LLEVADTGTLFLDEIGEMPLKMQAKILRVLETNTLRRVGGTSDIKVDVRFIAASNRDLRAAIDEGSLREDLFYRLSVVVVELPPLRERMQDLELFVAAFIKEFGQAMGKSIVAVSDEALGLMRSYDWPGNIREVRNVIERALVLCDGQEIQPAHLPAELSDGYCSPGGLQSPDPIAGLPPDGVDLSEVVSEMERRLIQDALERTGGNQSKAAELLSISRDQLRYRLDKYGLS
jgi:two-component system NtrC family response regulator